jgi:DNA-binding NarL/FixJ family response regulator
MNVVYETRKPLLTRRETEVLQLIAKGMLAKEIGNVGTVKNHLWSIHKKLGAYNTSHAVCIAKDRGMI